jgi:hypothetical protein
MTMGPRNSNQISMMGLRYSLYPISILLKYYEKYSERKGINRFQLESISHIFIIKKSIFLFFDKIEKIIDKIKYIINNKK